MMGRVTTPPMNDIQHIQWTLLRYLRDYLEAAGEDNFEWIEVLENGLAGDLWGGMHAFKHETLEYQSEVWAKALGPLVVELMRNFNAYAQLDPTTATNFFAATLRLPDL